MAASSTTLSTLCRGTGLVDHGGPKVWLQSTDMNFLSHTLDKKVLKRSREKARESKRHASRLPETYSTRRGLILLYPNSILQKKVLGEKGEHGLLEATILKETHFFSAEFEKWASAVLRENVSDEEELDVLTDLSGNSLGGMAQNSQLPSLFSADSMIAPNAKNKKIRPGLSARRYLINLTEGAESKLNCNWKGKGYVSDSTFFEANAVNPTLKRKVRSDLSEAPEPYSLSQFLSPAFPLHMHNSYSLPFLDDGELDLFPVATVGKENEANQTKENKAATEIKTLPTVKKPLDYARLPLDAKRALIVERLIQSAISMAIRKHKEIFETILGGHAFGEVMDPGRPLLQEPEEPGETRSAPSQDFNAALAAIAYYQQNSRTKAKSKIRDRQSSLAADHSYLAPFSTFLPPRPLGGRSKRVSALEKLSQQFPFPIEKKMQPLPPPASVAFEGPRGISISDENDIDDKELVDPEILNYEKESAPVTDLNTPVTLLAGSQLSSDPGSVLSRLFAKGATPAMKQILSSIPVEIFEAVEEDLVDKLATHADRIAKQVLAKAGSGRILEKDAKLAQELWAKFLLEPIPDKKRLMEHEMSRSNTHSLSPKPSPFAVGLPPKRDDGVRYSRSKATGQFEINQIRSTELKPQDTDGSNAPPPPRTVVTREFKGAFDVSSKDPLTHDNAAGHTPKHLPRQDSKGDFGSSSPSRKHSRQAELHRVPSELKMEFTPPTTGHHDEHQKASHEQKTDEHHRASPTGGKAAVERKRSASPKKTMETEHTTATSKHDSSLRHEPSLHKSELPAIQKHESTLRPHGGDAKHASENRSDVDSSHEVDKPKARHAQHSVLLNEPETTVSDDLAGVQPEAPESESETDADKPNIGADVKAKPPLFTKAGDHRQRRASSDKESHVKRGSDRKKSLSRQDSQPLVQEERSFDEDSTAEETALSPDSVRQKKTKSKPQRESPIPLIADVIDEEDETGQEVPREVKAAASKPKPKQKVALSVQKSVPMTDEDEGEGDESGDKQKEKRGSLPTISKPRSKAKPPAARPRNSSIYTDDGEDEDEKEEKGDRREIPKKAPLKRVDSKAPRSQQVSRGGQEDAEEASSPKPAKKALQRTDSKAKPGSRQQRDSIVTDEEKATEEGPHQKVGKKPSKEPKHKKEKPFITGVPEDDTVLPRLEEGKREGGKKGKSKGKKGKQKPAKEPVLVEMDGELVEVPSAAVEGEGSSSESEHLVLEGAVDIAVNFKRGRKQQADVRRKARKSMRPSDISAADIEDLLKEAADDVLIGSTEEDKTKVPSRKKEVSEPDFVFVPRSPTRMSQQLDKAPSSLLEKGEKESVTLDESVTESVLDESETGGDIAEGSMLTSKVNREELAKRRKEAVEQRRRERLVQKEEEQRFAEEEAERKEQIQKEIEREAKAIEEAARAEFDNLLKERAAAEEDAELQAQEAERLETFKAYVTDVEKQKLDEFKVKFHEELKRRRTSRALRRFESNAESDLNSLGLWLTDDQMMTNLFDQESSADSQRKGVMSIEQHKIAMEERRRASELQRRQLLFGQRNTQSAILRRKMFARRLEHWGLLNHAFRFTRAFVWSYFSLLQWLRVENVAEKLPSIEA